MSLLTLASASPRRAELMQILGVKHQIVPSLVDESSVGMVLRPESYVRALAMLKAEEVAERIRDGLVLGADTVVVLDDQILGKPSDVADAAHMLGRLRGRTHQVFTGVALVRCVSGVVSERIEDHAETEVRMRPFSDQILHAYLDTGEPMDKAGAYGIQGRGALLVEGIVGDFYNVMGLPVGRVAEMLDEFGIRCL